MILEFLSDVWKLISIHHYIQKRYKADAYWHCGILVYPVGTCSNGGKPLIRPAVGRIQRKSRVSTVRWNQKKGLGKTLAYYI